MRRCWLAALGVLVGACGSGAAPAQPPAQPGVIRGSGSVEVDYAGSLVRVVEERLGPAFASATGYAFAGESRGSVAIANLIRGRVRTPDVFISADPAVDASLAGPAGGNHVSWWVPFASTAMVVAWGQRSRFAAAFEDARAGRRTFESVLEQPGMRLGRTDPELDPKGYRTLWLFQLDEQRTGEAGEARRILGDAQNRDQVFPEEQLVARTQAGQLDAGIFYRVEAVAAGLPRLDLPAAIDQSDPALAASYATSTYTNQKGTTVRGSPIAYTVTIPSTVREPRGAQSFVAFLLGSEARAILDDAGLTWARAPVAGDAATVPPALRPLVGTG